MNARRSQPLRPGSPYRQQGISLLVSMILLAAITILALVAARTTLLELTMSGNEQKRIASFERAESAIDAMYELRTQVVDFNTEVGQKRCTANQSCDDPSLTLPAGFGDTSDENASHSAWVTRTGEAALVCPPAFLEISCTDAKAAFFEFQSQFDERATGGGNTTVTQGVLSILPDQD